MAEEQIYDLKSLLKVMGSGHMENTTYDTAWIARLNEIDAEISNKALEWICENQLEDGSWGAKGVRYYHDIVISTLSAMIALNYRGRRTQDRIKVERGMQALERITAGATQGLSADPNGATVGFEMIIPTLVSEGERLGIIKQQGDRILGKLARQRSAKMEKLKGLKVNRHLTAIFSTEMAGKDSLHLLDLDKLQEPNGSVAYSPASTAYYLLAVNPNDRLALNYLQETIKDGGAPFVKPFDIFERCWILWNYTLVEGIDDEMRQLIFPHLEHIKNNWVFGNGVSFTQDCALFDSDDTSVSFHILKHFGFPVDINALLAYEEENHFRCYQYEINPSIGVNAHVLHALKDVKYTKNHPTVTKILKFLYDTRIGDTYWFDKWHISPYYITSHIIICCSDYDQRLCQSAINWIVGNQREDGAWGYYENPTAEETAYALQALKFWQKRGGRVSKEIIAKGGNWLKQNAAPPYPWLWIGKSIYYPYLIVQSVILTALAMIEE
ncbi:MAG: cyclase [Chloroflexi bacterium]|nr:cyclase [Chloroflexota bacterium]